jgi:predicted membrane channel-forming protein YqfA (hemolysin III family)
MALSHKTRKRLSLFILLIGLPVYIALMVGIMGLVYDNFGQPPLLVELAIYVVLGVVAFFPLKPIFLGTSREDPDRPPPPDID